MNEQIDILMGTYNGAKYLREQIDSILSQTYQQIYLIIRDDGSIDETPQILDEFKAKYSERIMLIASDERLGIKGNFSALMHYSKANYVMLSDQDDVWKPSKAEVTLSKMKELENRSPLNTPLLVYTDLQVVDENLKPKYISFWKSSNLDPMRNHLNQLLVSNVVTGCTTMMNRALLKQALPVPPESMMHDWWLALVASTMGKMGFVPEATILYRQHGQNAVGAQNRNLKWFLKKTIQCWVNPKKEDKIPQAKALLARYGMCSSKSQCTLLNSFIEMPKQSFFRKRYSMIKNDFFTHGPFWNILLLCLGRPYR